MECKVKINNNFKRWLKQFECKDEAIFSVEYIDKAKQKCEMKYIKGGKALIKFIEEIKIGEKDIKKIDRIC